MKFRSQSAIKGETADKGTKVDFKSSQDKGIKMRSHDLVEF